MNDTICAISTPIGVGGISIIRISGNDAINITSQIFDGKNLNECESHTIHYGHIIDDEKIIDEVLISVMKSPKTYTTEDVVEINVHGGIATTNKVLQMLIERGIRLAEPGEFTKRAFLNGRIDLTQAEAVSDIIQSENEIAREVSINQLSGKLSEMIRTLKKKILSIEANIEVNIDYPEYDDIEDMTESKVYIELNQIKSEMQKLIDESKTGKIIKQGINVLLLGKPNVGKSSILNALLDEEKAIVTDIAGTTRDIVEGKMILNGIVLNFIDTAGIRETTDTVEKIGVNRSIDKMKEADLIILVLSNADELSNEDKKLIDLIDKKNHIIFVNKNDLNMKIDISNYDDVVFGNTLDSNGLDDLKKKIISLFELDKITTNNTSLITNSRQLGLLKKAKNSIEDALQAYNDGMSVDVIQIDISNARKYLGEILGEVYNDELLDTLFSNFCLGK